MMLFQRIPSQEFARWELPCELLLMLCRGKCPETYKKGADIGKPVKRKVLPVKKAIGTDHLSHNLPKKAVTTHCRTLYLNTFQILDVSIE